ncbi:MAG: glycosyltransferase, partial [Bacteroidales bacterium]|nr:glycosyltransferase [Bacteroidales bacterium]
GCGREVLENILEKKVLKNLLEKKENSGRQLPGNLILYSRLEQKDLKELYLRSKVYCQLSRSESFGVAMAEAMYFNCIPVYTSAGGLKEVAGEYGFMVSGNDPDEISTAIKRAHSTTEISDSRERIGRLFTYIQRAEKINDEDFVIGL